MAVVIKLRRGLKVDLPLEAELGEGLWTTDTQELYFGQGAGLPLKKHGATDKTFDLTSQVDGVRVEFTIPMAYIPGSAKPMLNGIRLRPSEFTENSPGAGKFTLSFAPTYNINPNLSDSIIVDCKVLE
jgi:hypothetical protein